LPEQAIAALVKTGAIAADVPVGKDQIQPASLDLRLGVRAWRVRASFLPSAKTGIGERLESLALHQIELSERGTVLETGCVYIVELEERL
jgi:dCTP deaminase